MIYLDIVLSAVFIAAGAGLFAIGYSAGFIAAQRELNKEIRKEKP